MQMSGPDAMEPFLVRALVAGAGLALMAAPLGCFVAWQRMAYFGETVAQASLIGIALGLALQLDTTVSALAASALMALGLSALARQSVVPLDSLLGFLAHAALACGVIATALVRGPSVDLMGYLFGDIFAVSTGDLAMLLLVGALVLGVLGWLWRALLSLAVHEELAQAEGVRRDLVRTVFVLLLALFVAVAIKVVGVLLAIAFLIMPAAAARPLSATPERMAALAAAIAVASVLAGLELSLSYDIPGGPAIVAVLAAIAGASLAGAAARSSAR